jgi:hypothetical protein
VRSLRWQTLNLDDFVLAPLPNTLFHRDNSACVYGGVTINPMAKATPGSERSAVDHRRPRRRAEITTHRRRPAAAGRAPLALTTWWSVATPLLAVLCLLLGWPLPSPAVSTTW